MSRRTARRQAFYHQQRLIGEMNRFWDDQRWMLAVELDDDDRGEYLGHVTCWECGGSGTDIVCMDDLCRNGDHCIHGDGERMCSACDGEGVC